MFKNVGAIHELPLHFKNPKSKRRREAPPFTFWVLGSKSGDYSYII
jgi:hypothetical protein